MNKVVPLILACFLIPVACAGAAEAPDAASVPLPVSYFFKNAEVGFATLSPNGRYLATTAREAEGLQLRVVDLERQEAKVLIGYADQDIANASWIGNERIAFSLIDRSTPDNAAPGGLYTIARTGGLPTTLMEAPRQLRYTGETGLRGMSLIRSARDGSRNVLALGHIFGGGDARPLLIDSVDGKRRELDYKFPGKPLYFWFDGSDQPRVAIASTGEDVQTLVVWYRDSGDNKWRSLASYPALAPTFEVAGFVGDTLYVSAPAGERWALYKYDTQNNKLGELVLANPETDVGGGLLAAPGGDKLLGVRLSTEPPRTHWFERSYASQQAAIDAAMPGKVNMIFPSEGDAPRLVLTYSDTDPGQLRRYDPPAKRLSLLTKSRPWIDPARMSNQIVFDYKARDGLPIMAYLTLPKGRTPKGLPLIVLPHGGPTARDHWGFSQEVQFLASRGYAVLQPQFRGSVGFGIEHIKKGFRQWGLAMQDDLTDGVRNLAAQGLIDPARVCIMGTSYGGYAAMMGLVRDPAMYKCGVNLMGVTDLSELLDKGRWIGEAYRYGTKTTIADPATMKAQIAATSPVNRASEMQAPVFMAYGEKDQRVPLEHGTGMRDALKKHGKTYEWMSFANEEHGLAYEENRYKLFGALEVFLRKYNPAQ